FAELAGEGARIDPAPPARKRRFDLDRQLRCLAVHAAQGHDLAVELEYDLPALGDVRPGGRNARNAKCAGFALLLGNGRAEESERQRATRDDRSATAIQPMIHMSELPVPSVDRMHALTDEGRPEPSKGG